MSFYTETFSAVGYPIGSRDWRRLRDCADKASAVLTRIERAGLRPRTLRMTAAERDDWAKLTGQQGYATVYCFGFPIEVRV